MGKCQGCGKKLRFFEGYSFDGKDWCEDCHDKKNRIVRKKEKHQKVNDKKLISIHRVNKEKNEEEKIRMKIEARNWLSGLGFVFIILFILWTFGFFDLFYLNEEYEEYRDCVDSCVSDNTYCINNIYPLLDKYGEEYLELFEVESCGNELESCVYDCESLLP